MKTWTVPAEKRAALKKHLSERWKDETDEEVARAFGFSRQYVKNVRVRMKLGKDLTLIKDIRSERILVNGKERPERVRRRVLSEAEKLELRIRRKGQRDIERMKREYPGFDKIAHEFDI